MQAQVHAAEPRREVWAKAEACGVETIVADVKGLTSLNLDLIVDFAGFGSTTAGAIGAIRPGGLVVQVGLGRVEATISTAELVGKAVTSARLARRARRGYRSRAGAHAQRRARNRGFNCSIPGHSRVVGTPEARRRRGQASRNPVTQRPHKAVLRPSYFHWAYSSLPVTVSE